MIRRQVQQHRDLGGERDRVLELERRDLADDRRLGRRRADQRGRGRSNVAGDLDRQASLAVDVADPLGRRRLAVGAGHGDELVLEQTPCELDLAENREAARSCRRDDRGASGYARALDERPRFAKGGNRVT